MANSALARLSKEHVPVDVPAWLFILLQDSLREADDALVNEGTMGAIGRAIVWTMGETFDCLKLGVPGQACRLFEHYMANVVRMGIYANYQQDLVDYMTPRLLLTVGCCFQIAMKSISSTVCVRPKDMRAFLASCGADHTISEIMEMERDVFRGLGCHVPLYNSIEMAELLAEHSNVNRDALERIGLFVQLAELRRPEIEEEVRYIAGLSRMPFCFPRVRTVHLAAGCVAAAVNIMFPETSDNLANSLATMLRISGRYVMVLREVILAWAVPRKPPAPKPPAPKPPTPKHRPNILRRKRVAVNASEPQPSTSKSTPF